MEYIYVLRLEQNKFYVGKSNNVKQRVQQHLMGQGGAWTEKYRPLCIEKKEPAERPTHEDATVKEFMFQFGIDNVRGGSYSQIALTDAQLEVL